MVFGEMLGAKLGAFFGHEADEMNLHGQRRDEVAGFVQSPEHGGHGAFRIAGSTTPDTAVTHLTAEGVDGHASDADGIRVRAEAKTRLGFAIRARLGGKTTDYIRPAWLDFIQEDLRTCSSQKFTDELRTGVFTGLVRAGITIGVHGGDANEGLTELGDIRRQGRHVRMKPQALHRCKQSECKGCERGDAETLTHCVSAVTHSLFSCRPFLSSCRSWANPSPKPRSCAFL